MERITHEPHHAWTALRMDHAVANCLSGQPVWKFFPLAAAIFLTEIIRQRAALAVI
jgi:hypothetical protein